MIYVSHGVAARPVSNRISQMLLLRERDFVVHMQSRKQPYVSLEEALAGLGDALTVDDATMAGFRAVMLARRYGHAVTWFINGFHVSEDIPYSPFLISCMIDDTTRQGCFFNDLWWELGTPVLRQAFRLYLKQIYLEFAEHQQIEEFLTQLARSLDRKALMIDPELATAGANEVMQAALVGARLENHGWTHLNPKVIRQEICVEELKRNAEWLDRIRPGQLDVYAPPYGYPVTLPPEACSVMLLADRSLKGERLAPHLVNRVNLTLRSSVPIPAYNFAAPSLGSLRA